MTLERRLQLVQSRTEESAMATMLKVAFATADMKHVDQHFGAAKSFAIYAIDPAHASFVEANEFGQLDMDGNEDKLGVKANPDGSVTVTMVAARYGFYPPVVEVPVDTPVSLAVVGSVAEVSSPDRFGLRVRSASVRAIDATSIVWVNRVR